MKVIEILNIVGRVEYIPDHTAAPYRATIQCQKTGCVWVYDAVDGYAAEGWIIDWLARYEQWLAKQSVEI